MNNKSCCKDYLKLKKYYKERKKVEEDELSNEIRELSNIEANKFCAECGQRGPTYVNVTQGSFCCMHCSGLLRGLTPPHRVKSISMSTFTISEVDLLRKRGNQWNKEIYLALFKGTKPFKQPIDSQNLKDHMILKYEKRMWYSAPKCSTVIIGAKELFAIPKSGSCFARFNNFHQNYVREVVPKYIKYNENGLHNTNNILHKNDTNRQEYNDKKTKESIFDKFDDIFGPLEPIKKEKSLTQSTSLFNFPEVSTKKYDWPCSFEELDVTPTKQSFDPFSTLFLQRTNYSSSNNSTTIPSYQSFSEFDKYFQQTLPNDSDTQKNVINLQDPSSLQKDNYYQTKTTTNNLLVNDTCTSKVNGEQSKALMSNPFLSPLTKLDESSNKHIYSNPFENLSNCSTLTNNPFISQSQPSSLEKELTKTSTFESFFTTTNHHHSEMVLNEREKHICDLLL
uniref:Arf-GAP domain-containing protein n=1 Tax=Parastrongyloides trichosuri TaxID=131310 RepID=A0A0N4ZLV7_PARTI